MRTCVDHLGVEYPTISTMCKMYNVPEGTYKSRIRLGYNQEEALTGKNIPKIGNPKMCVDHLGVEYPSIAAMCKSYNISLDTYKSRIRIGRSIEEALTDENKRGNRKACIDHLGVEYPSIAAMCKSYNISRGLYKSRIKVLGWTLEEALTGKRNK